MVNPFRRAKEKGRDNRLSQLRPIATPFANGRLSRIRAGRSWVWKWCYAVRRADAGEIYPLSHRTIRRGVGGASKL